MKPKTVYGGCFFMDGRQVRGIIFGTQKQAADATGCSKSYIAEYWCATGNKTELEIAQQEPGVLFWCENVYTGRVYKPAGAQ